MTHPAAGVTAARRNRRKMIILAGVGVLAVVVHLWVGGALLAASRWTLGVAAVVLVMVAVMVLGKLVMLGLGRRAVRRGQVGHRFAHFHTGAGQGSPPTE